GKSSFESFLMLEVMHYYKGLANIDGTPVQSTRSLKPLLGSRITSATTDRDRRLIANTVNLLSPLAYFLHTRLAAVAAHPTAHTCFTGAVDSLND
ncbi:hypothetical protein HAX54_047141, partial [Datura stramonium]|nr:hypothetical protein [Datura stramonium]